MRKLVELLIIGFVACASTAANQEEASKPLQVGDKAPDFALQDATDQTHSLKKLRGKVIVLILEIVRFRKKMINGHMPFRRIIKRTIKS